MTHAKLGNLYAFVVICFFAAAAYNSFEFGAVGYLGVGVIAWAAVWLLFFFATPKADALSKFAFSDAEIVVYRRYYLHRLYPAAAETCSAFLNSMRYAGLIWVAVCFGKHLPGVAIALIVYFFLVAGFIVRLDPAHYLVPDAKEGNRNATKQLELLESIEKKYAAYFRGETEEADS